MCNLPYNPFLIPYERYHYINSGQPISACIHPVDKLMCLFSAIPASMLMTYISRCNHITGDSMSIFRGNLHSVVITQRGRLVLAPLWLVGLGCVYEWLSSSVCVLRISMMLVSLAWLLWLVGGRLRQSVLDDESIHLNHIFGGEYCTSNILDV